MKKQIAVAGAGIGLLFLGACIGNSTSPAKPVGADGVEPPKLVSPLAGSKTDLQTRFTWEASKGAMIYQVQVAKDATFGYLVVNTAGIPEAFFDAPQGELGQGARFWRVKAAGPTAVSGWSEVGQCIVGSSPSVPQPAPKPVDPKPTTVAPSAGTATIK